MMVNFIQYFAATACKSGDLLGVIPTWYKYLQLDPATCSVNIDLTANPQQFWLIGFAIIDILLRVAGLVAVGFVIYGGFSYVTSQGESEKLKNSRSIIINALIGVAIAVVAGSLIGFFAGQFSESTASRTVLTNVVSTLPNVDASTSSPLDTVLTVAFGILGTVSLLIIVLSGFRYITSQGEPDKVNKAKDGIIYAAIGLAISVAAYSIVAFVINKL